MIEVTSLAKSYGPIAALEGVSFAVPSGEVVGLLGPNGAGKTTTMRILAGALAATGGTARIDGVDVLAEPIAVKRIVGYLPEHPPLYDEMTVEGYLRFCAALKDASPGDVERPELWSRLGLDTVRHRIVGRLSKGFRQRVGLAQAMVHRPRVLILDEPLAGLDPEQRIEIRNAIRQLAQDGATVLVSSHALTEIEAVCDRVIVLRDGLVRGIETPEPASRRIEIRVARPGPSLVEAIEGLDPLLRIQTLDDGRYRIAATDDVREAVANMAVSYGLLELRQVGLEQRFLDLVADAPEETA